MKNQKGVSLITLVITIIIAILLASMALRGGGTDNAGKAYFAGFVQEMDDLQSAITTEFATIKGNEVLRAHSVSEAQVYNYLARGGEMATPAITKDASGDELWLTRTQASAISCTPLNREYAATKFNLKKRKVETNIGKDQTLSYFITPMGRVFCWPPYVSDDKSYVTPSVLATTVTGTPITGYDATRPGTVSMITFGSEEERNVEIIYVTSVETAPTLTKIIPNETTISASTTSAPAVYYVRDLADTVTGGTAMGYSFEAKH